MVEITPSQLANVNKSARKLIIDYITKKGITLNYFAKQSGCHQNQLWLYLYSNESNKGLHSGTLEKIGMYIYSNK
jgi:lambda repressor-like predicted transcriptional regulator